MEPALIAGIVVVVLLVIFLAAVAVQRKRRQGGLKVTDRPPGPTEGGAA